MSFTDHCDVDLEPTPPAPGKWHDEAPTEPNAARGLDPVLLAGVEREAGIALKNTMEGRHHVAAAHGRRALDLLLLAHARNERRSMLERLAAEAP